MKDVKFDMLFEKAAHEMADKEAEAMKHTEEAELQKSTSDRASKLINRKRSVYIPVKRRVLTVLVAALILALLSTTCMAIPDIHEQLSEMLGPKENMTLEEKLYSQRYIYNGEGYTVYELESLSDVELNRVAGAGGELYRFLDRIDEICGSTEHSNAILSRLRTPYTVTDLSYDGAYRLRLEEISGAFLTLTGAEEFLSFVGSAEADALDPDLPLIYHLINYCGTSEEELRRINKEELSSLLGYPLTEKEIRLLVSRDSGSIIRELSEDISYFSGNELYTPYELAYCDSDTFVALMREPNFTDHLCRLARTYALDGTDIGSYRDWAIKRYEFFSKN